VSHGKNPQSWFSNYVRDVIGKDAQIDSPVTAPSQPANLGTLSNPKQSPIDFVLESLSEAGLLPLVVGDVIKELKLGFPQKGDVHHGRRL
jgi:hypothetical protein